jgi:hypothetical protein
LLETERRGYGKPSAVVKTSVVISLEVLVSSFAKESVVSGPDSVNGAVTFKTSV